MCFKNIEMWDGITKVMRGRVGGGGIHMEGRRVRGRRGRRGGVYTNLPLFHERVAHQ